jgi:FMN phosphatase YigB (HAD superfamily)
MKYILTDVDDTVLRFAEPFEEWVMAQGIKINQGWRKTYDIRDMIASDSREDHLALIKGYAEAHRGSQPAVDCAAEVIPHLQKQGYRFVAITACGNDQKFREERIRNLEKAFGFTWDAVHTVSMQGSKRAALALYPPSIWVEDNFKHAVVGADLGHRSFILTRPHNEGLSDERVSRVSCWRSLRIHLEQ